MTPWPAPGTDSQAAADLLAESGLGADARAHVGGYSATMSDLGQRVQQRLPLLVTVLNLLSVREEYLRTGDPSEAVIHGIAVTARTISSAAAIMVAVFGGFVLGDDPILKMLGLGLATAVLIDATVIRLVWVPATMGLLGSAAWWLPTWLDRLLPRLDPEPGTELAARSSGVSFPGPRPAASGAAVQPVERAFVQDVG